MRKSFLISMAVMFSFSTVSLVSQEEQKQEGKLFSSFTGKILGNKVRLRLSPDLDSQIVKELNKGDLILIVGESDDFWTVSPPSDTKVYVYKTYIHDNVVEANRVNIRLKPDLESPIIGQLNQNDKICAQPYATDPKWLEISPPEHFHYYVAKEYISQVGDIAYFDKMQKRKNEVSRLLNSAFFITQGECKKPFNEMSPQDAVSQFEAIIQGYNDFPDFVQQAKEGLSLLQDNFLQKKIAYLEAKAELTEIEKEELLSKLSITQVPSPTEKESDNPLTASTEKKEASLSEKMSFWKPVEDSLFQTWTTFNPDKSKDLFYKEQEVNATLLSGLLESYEKSVQNKPGDYLLKTPSGQPIGFLYSTQIDLEKHVGKEITLSVSPRPNNNFAFPAYYVISVE